MQTPESVLYSLQDGVGTLTLNRPDALNAMNLEMGAAAINLLRAAKADPALRVLVVTGAGKHFSAGGDVKAMAAGLESGSRIFFERELPLLNELIEELAGFPVPTVAVVRGVAAGGGCSLALVCDFRLCAEDARFLQAFVNIGLAPDTGSSFFLPRLIGLGRALEMCLLGEPVDARTALSIGLCHRVAPAAELDSTAADFCAKLRAKSPAALQKIRALLLSGCVSSMSDAITAETRDQQALGAGDEFKAALQGFLSKAPARFERR